MTITPLSPGCGGKWEGGLGSSGAAAGDAGPGLGHCPPTESCPAHGPRCSDHPLLCRGVWAGPGWVARQRCGGHAPRAGRQSRQSCGGSHCQVPAMGPGRTEALLYTDRPRIESQGTTCPLWDLGPPCSSPGPHFPNNKMGLIRPISLVL